VHVSFSRDTNALVSFRYDCNANLAQATAVAKDEGEVTLLASIVIFPALRLLELSLRREACGRD
jgi:hypothetical protein